MKWTEEKLQEEADKYKTRGDFKKSNNSAYLTANNKKLIDELFKNHPNKGYSENIKPNSYWTKEILQKEANKYKTRGEFQKNNAKAYDAAKIKNIINELFENHLNKGYERKHKNCWTIETLQKDANKCETRGEFKKYSAAYTFALRNNLIDELFKNHPNNGLTDKKLPDGYWTEEKLQEEANKYLTRDEFNIKNSSAYSIANRKKIMDKLFKNHLNKGYSDKEEWKENRYVIYVYELPEFNKAYVGLTNNIERRDREHLFSEKEKMSLFCKENNISLPKYKILEDNLTCKTVRNQEKYWEQFYRDNDWEMFNIAKTGGLGSVKKWSKKALQEEANKYLTRDEFNKKNANAYSASFSRNILNELFKNHPNKGYKNKIKN